MSEQHQKIILFDGVCNLCNGFVRFIIRRDNRNVFRFGSLQSAASQTLLHQFNQTAKGRDSVILLEDGRMFSESDAILQIAEGLGLPWRVVSWGRILPKFLRDTIYRLVSRYRYTIFGKRDSCMVPAKELLNRFI